MVSKYEAYNDFTIPLYENGDGHKFIIKIDDVPFHGFKLKQHITTQPWFELEAWQHQDQTFCSNQCPISRISRSCDLILSDEEEEQQNVSNDKRTERNTPHFNGQKLELLNFHRLERLYHWLRWMGDEERFEVFKAVRYVEVNGTLAKLLHQYCENDGCVNITLCDQYWIPSDSEIITTEDPVRPGRRFCSIDVARMNGDAWFVMDGQYIVHDICECVEEDLGPVRFLYPLLPPLANMGSSQLSTSILRLIDVLKSKTSSLHIPLQTQMRDIFRTCAMHVFAKLDIILRNYDSQCDIVLDYSDPLATPVHPITRREPLPQTLAMAIEEYMFKQKKKYRRQSNGSNRISVPMRSETTLSDRKGLSEKLPDFSEKGTFSENQSEPQIPPNSLKEGNESKESVKTARSKKKKKKKFEVKKNRKRGRK
jgi:hypothetical protein